MQTEQQMKLEYSSKRKLINPSFRLLWIGRLISQLGDKLYLLALPWLVLEISHSAFYTAITLSLEILPEILFGPFIGVYVDQKSRKKLMILADWIRGILILAITVLAYHEKIEIFHIYVVTFLLSGLTLLFDSSSQGYLSQIVPKDLLVEANANLTFVATLMRLVGPFLSGVFIGWIGAKGTIGLNGLSFIISGIILSFLPNDSGYASEKMNVDKIIDDMKEGFRYLFHHQILFPIALFSTFMNIGIYMVSTLFVFQSKEVLGYGPEQTSTIFWVSGIVATLTTLNLKHLKNVLTKGKMIRLGSIGVFLAILLLVLNQSLVTFTLSYSLLLMIGIIVNVNMMAYRQEIIPPHLFGRVMTSSRVLVNLFSPVAMIVAGWIATTYSAQWVFHIAAFIIFINILYSWFGRLRMIK
ncbi:MFS transporter [Tepidibacillus sp. LV47]|uniref:MFS transporter n=1 Tax=Tepidibacillus sp. LV47 TaxID=3398228 RepID=UPI003AADD630